MIDNTKLGQNLKIARGNIKQKVIAEQAHIAAQTLSSYENGKRLPTLEDLVTLADVLGRSVDELLERDKSNTNADSNKMFTAGDLLRLIDWQYKCGALKFGEIEYLEENEEWELGKPYNNSCAGIGFTDPTIIKLIDAYQDLSKLKDKGTLEPEYFNQWLEGQIEKFDRIVLYTDESFDPFTELEVETENLDGDLPF